MDNMRNIVRLKDVPSNTIEEAIIIFKDNKKAPKYEYLNKFDTKNIDRQDDNSYVIKEAELIIADYIENAEPKDDVLKEKIRRYKFISFSLGLFLIISILL